MYVKALFYSLIMPCCQGVLALHTTLCIVLVQCMAMACTLDTKANAMWDFDASVG